MKKIWEELEMAYEDWRHLAEAFYSLAHNDFKEFIALPQYLKETPSGMLCTEYMETGDRDLIERAGRIITRSDCWYVYLGRIM